MMTVSATTGLTAGQIVTWSVSGFTPGAFGGFEECSQAPNMPTQSILGNPVPVGCSPASVKTVKADGTFSGAFIVRSPVAGPPVANSLDSANILGETDALNYPCPPTQAQVNAGITCTFAFGTGVTENVTIPIHFANEPTPQSNITVSAGPDVTGLFGTQIALTGSATDPDSATPTYAWTTDGPNCTFDSPTTLNTNISCSTAGVFAATLTVSDGGINPPTSDAATVTVTSPNQPPVVNAGGNVTGLVDSDLNLNGSVNDPDSTPDIQWTVDNPTACFFDDDTAPQTSINCDTAGTYIVTLTANDHINAPVHDQATVTVNPLPPGLNANAGSDVSGNVNTAIVLNGTITDPGQTPLAHWTVDSPTCVFGNANTAVTTITCASSGVFAAVLTGTDGGVHSPSIDTALVTVIAPNQPPTVNSGGNVFGKANTAIALHGTVTDPDNTPTILWSVDSPNCTFGNLHLADTTITCTANGVYAATLKGSDGVNPPVMSTAIVSVVNNIPPSVSAGPDVSGLPNTDIALHGTVTDPDNSPVITWVTQSPNCTFGNAGVADTTINCSVSGVVAATLTANDGVNPPVSSTAIVSVAAPNVPPTVHAGPDTDAIVGHNVTLNGSVTDPDSTPTVQWATGSPNCSFGTPTAAVTTFKCTVAGIYAATITAADGVNTPVSATALVTFVPGQCQKPCLSIGDATAYEGANVSLPIVLSTPQSTNITATATIEPITATNCRVTPTTNCAFKTSVIHNITIRAGVRFTYVSVTALTNTDPLDGDRTFNVRLSNVGPVGTAVTLGKALGTGTIKNSTGLDNQFLVGSMSMPEMDTCSTCKATAKVSVSLDAVPATNVSVAYTTVAQGAPAGTFTAKHGTLTFLAGGTTKKFVSIITIGDNAIESLPYGIGIQFSNPLPAGWSVTNGPGLITMLDND
jgi:hypothetical protein